MVECYGAPGYIHLIGNRNIWKVPKHQLNLTYIMNNSKKNASMFVGSCLFNQQIH